MRARNNVIQGHVDVANSTILAGIVVSSHQIGLGQRDFASFDLHKSAQTQNGRDWKGAVHTMHTKTISRDHNLCLTQETKYHCATSSAYT
ncbi:hypothetical protein ES703_94281 [subsurface metagenome]